MKGRHRVCVRNTANSKIIISIISDAILIPASFIICEVEKVPADAAIGFSAESPECKVGLFWNVRGSNIAVHGDVELAVSLGVQTKGFCASRSKMGYEVVFIIQSVIPSNPRSSWIILCPPCELRQLARSARISMQIRPHIRMQIIWVHFLIQTYNLLSPAPPCSTAPHT